MMTKKFISIILSIIVCMCMVSPVTATAKVTEPEVVKTEKWTTSYYIDDDIDTLYPYIQCEADIYNDGMILLYMWNTHEWDGFATVSHFEIFSSTIPLPYNDIILDINEYKKCAIASRFGGEFFQLDTTKFIDFSYFDDNYDITIYADFGTVGGLYDDGELHLYRDEHSNYGKELYHSVLFMHRPLAKIPTNERELIFELYPKVDPTGTYNFRLFGHDITITPELLSENIVATPSDDGYKTITYNNGSSASKIKTDTDVSDIQKYIDDLEAKNALLRQENTELKNRINLLATGTYGDVNGDQAVDVQDAQIILAYYTERDVAKKSVPDLVTFGLNFGKDQ